MTVELDLTHVSEGVIRWLVHAASGDETRAAIAAARLDEHLKHADQIALLRVRLQQLEEQLHTRDDVIAAYRKKLRDRGVA